MKLAELLQRYAGKSVQSSVDERKETITIVSKPAINDMQKKRYMRLQEFKIYVQ